MNPIPCAHCGYNFMRRTIDPEAPRICNSCGIREEIRTKKKEEKKMSVGIVINFTEKQHAEIEEYCLKENKSFSEYFMNLHEINMNQVFCVQQLEEGTQELFEDSKESKKNTVPEKNLYRINKNFKKSKD